MEAAPRSSLLARHEFLIRRLHSLSGLVPVGAYMVIHLLTNASVLNGPQSFQGQVDTIHSLGRALPVVEWTFVYIPILFHALIGVLMIAKMVPNTGSYPYAGNVRYTLQRATGMIAFAFIAVHVCHMDQRFGAPFRSIGGAQFDHHAATSTAATALQAAVWVQVLYLVGLASCVYHLANGLWTMGITWGVWTTPQAQRKANYLAVGFGALLSAVALSAWLGMITADVPQARAFEQARAEMEAERARRQQELLEQSRSKRSAGEEESSGGPQAESVAQQGGN